MKKEDALIKQVISFRSEQGKTQTIQEGEIPYFYNNFWTSKQRKSHSLHEISYRACFKAELPQWFISRTTKVGDWVLDPFQGRGTTTLQACLMGRNAIGNDINPLSAMLVKPRLQPPHLEQIKAYLDRLPQPDEQIERDDLLAFYHPSTLLQLQSLKNHCAAEGANDPVWQWIRMVCLHLLSGHSSGFFSVYTMPPNQAVSIKSQLKINTRLAQVPPQRDIKALVLKKSIALLRSGLPPITQHKLLLGSADNLTGIDAELVSLAVTSPPFLDIVQYADDNWLRSWFAGINTEKVEISMLSNPTEWQAMIKRTLTELARVLVSGGIVSFEVGEVSKKDKSGNQVQLEKLVWQAAETLPFQRLGIMINNGNFTKTANMWGIKNNNKGTNTNRIVLLRKLPAEC